MQTPALRSAGSHGIRWGWTAAMGIGALSIALIIWNWTQNFAAPQMTDYLSYWAAGKLAIAGDPAAAYDVARHRAVEFSVAEFKGLLPFPYPPPFLLLVAPFSLLPYIWAFAAWVAVTLAIYLLVTRRTVDAACSLSHPSVLMNGLIGQNGFLTAAIFTAGVSLLRKRPFLAGIILGSLIMKPQLALLLPVAVIAARLWSAVGGALASAAALGLVSLALFGTGVFSGFVEILPLYRELMRQDKWPWNEFISVFAFVRYFGIDQSVALTIHFIVAAAAAALTWIAWSHNWEGQLPILAAATLLIPPYLLTYDALLMIIPIGFWVREQPRPWLAGALWLLCFLPIAFYFNLYRGPNTVPVAAMLALCVLAAARWKRRGANVDDADLIRVDPLPG